MFRVLDSRWMTIFEFETADQAAMMSAYIQEANTESEQPAYHEPKKRPLTLHGAIRAISELKKTGNGSYSLAFILAELCHRFGGCFRTACILWVEEFPEDFFSLYPKGKP